MPVIEMLVLLVFGHLGYMIALQPKLVESRIDCYYGAVSSWKWPEVENQHMVPVRDSPRQRTCISVGLRITIGFSSIFRDISVATIKS